MGGHGIEADTQQERPTVVVRLLCRDADGGLEAVVATTETCHLGPFRIVALHVEVGAREVPLEQGTTVSHLTGKEVARGIVQDSLPYHQ